MQEAQLSMDTGDGFLSPLSQLVFDNVEPLAFPPVACLLCYRLALTFRCKPQSCLKFNFRSSLPMAML